jgi:UDP-N-acetylmuramoyl-L-alanyl-D-glutamate--2,6-diaminopimelate ligase
VRTPHGDIRVESPLLGLPNLYNWLGAIGAALVVGIPIPTIEAGIRNLESVRGRFERVGEGEADGDRRLRAQAGRAGEIAARRPRDRGRAALKIVFGCGGDRDRGKRPQMGEIAGAARR